MQGVDNDDRRPRVAPAIPILPIKTNRDGMTLENLLSSTISFLLCCSGRLLLTRRHRYRLQGTYDCALLVVLLGFLGVG